MSGGGGDCTMTGVDCLECNSLFEETSHQKFSVPLCHLPGAGANKTDEITVKPISFIHDPSLAPLSEGSHAGPGPRAGHQSGVMKDSAVQNLS